MSPVMLEANQCRGHKPSDFVSSTLSFSAPHRERIRGELSGSSLGKHGYVVEVCICAPPASYAITCLYPLLMYQIIEISDEDIVVGLVDNDSGCVSVSVLYTAILLRPFPLEVLDAIVTNAVESGFFANVGPLEIFVSRHVSFAVFCLLH